MKKILIVDDNQIFMDAFKFILKYEFGIENIDNLCITKRKINRDKWYMNCEDYKVIFNSSNGNPCFS